MAQARYTFNFCIKNSRAAADGKAPIYMRVTVDCDRKEKATNLFVEPQEWDSRFGLSRGADKYSLSLNSRLAVIRTKMLEATPPFRRWANARRQRPCSTIFWASSLRKRPSAE